MVECESTLGQVDFPAHIVLIDTWWNVNMNGQHIYLSGIGFNRYMVECE